MSPAKTESSQRLLAYFISPHGYGHASRACAVMSALHELDPAVRFEIFTTVPYVFFQSSLSGNFNYHPVLTDIGLVQTSPLKQDLEATIKRLDNFLPFRHDLLTGLAREVRRLKCELVISDIAPLGIAVAQAARVPSVLVENFTWDWLYEGFASKRLARHIPYLEQIFRSSDYHIQLAPVCRRHHEAPLVQPVSRKPRTAAASVRTALRLPEKAQLVLITMGGVKARHAFLERLPASEPVYFVIPGASETIERVRNQIRLPQHCQFYHPDLIRAASVVIGKVGYSTLAEVYYAGIPFGYVSRPDFRESDVLTTYLREHFAGRAIASEAFEAGHWLTLLPELLTMPRRHRSRDNGAEQVAAFIKELFYFSHRTTG